MLSSTRILLRSSTFQLNPILRVALTQCNSYSTKKGTEGKVKDAPARGKTPIGKLDEFPDGVPHPAAEKDPLPPWPNGVNPHTGEQGGPRGPEPTRYGDWERKGRVTDF